MEADEYRRLAQQESVLWWFGLLHRNLFAALGSLGLSVPGLTCGDFGCGTGGFVAKLPKRFPRWSVVSLDKSSGPWNLPGGTTVRILFSAMSSSLHSKPACSTSSLRWM